MAAASAIKVAFMVVGIAATAWILGQYGTILVYGLPAPFIRRVPVTQPPNPHPHVPVPPNTLEGFR